jgi:hypothetical protein
MERIIPLNTDRILRLLIKPISCCWWLIRWRWGHTGGKGRKRGHKEMCF